MSRTKLGLALGSVILFLIVGIGWYVLQNQKATPDLTLPTPEAPTATTTEVVVTSPKMIIGTSVEGRPIESYTYGSGSKTVLLVGGIHGGYEWNSSLLAYEVIAALENDVIAVPETLKVIVIPTLNPDGLFTATGVTGSFTQSDIPAIDINTTGIGRFNANGVDLNRNFDCKWAPQSSWRGKVVSAGTAPFSEPEAAALRDLVVAEQPAAVLFWHSQAGAVYASECEAGVLPETLTLMNLYGEAGNYTPVPVFDAYPITGDAEGWLASLGIPAITIELETRTETEWERNRAGTEAVLTYLAQ